MVILVIISVLFVALLVWINILASIAVHHDHTLETFQKNAQFIIIWLIPIFGASFVLRLVFDHSPEAIPKTWIPWPLKSLIYGKPIKAYKNRDDHEIDTYPGRSRSNSDFGGDASGGDGGGGGD
jgi:uncharacterized membrane protein YcgQ (UPF0703/DUF1980 family)